MPTPLTAMVMLLLVVEPTAMQTGSHRPVAHKVRAQEEILRAPVLAQHQGPALDQAATMDPVADQTLALVQLQEMVLVTSLRLAAPLVVMQAMDRTMVVDLERIQVQVQTQTQEMA
jgi:hypothetical protein